MVALPGGCTARFASLATEFLDFILGAWTLRGGLSFAKWRPRRAPWRRQYFGDDAFRVAPLLFGPSCLRPEANGPRRNPSASLPGYVPRISPGIPHATRLALRPVLTLVHEASTQFWRHGVATQPVAMESVSRTNCIGGWRRAGVLFNAGCERQASTTHDEAATS